MFPTIAAGIDALHVILAVATAAAPFITLWATHNPKAAAVLKLLGDAAHEAHLDELLAALMAKKASQQPAPPAPK